MATTYTIKNGDTLYDIAKRNNTTVADIQRSNPSITDVNKVNAGATINLPGESSSYKSGGGSLPVAGAYRSSSPDRSDDNGSGGDFDYDEYMKNIAGVVGARPEYDISFDAELDRIYEKIMNREKFSYDFNEDALYDQYKDSYTRAGHLAMENTVGQAASLTGGYANSWGQTAGQQAFNQYMQDLNDIIPTLEERAYARYAAEGDALYDQYALAADKRDTQYARYQDDLSNWWQGVSLYNDRSDAAYSKEMAEREWQYQQERDAVADRQWQETFDYNKYIDERDRNYQQARDFIEDSRYQAENSGGIDIYDYDYTEDGIAYFTDSEGNIHKEQAGQNPYTSTVNRDGEKIDPATGEEYGYCSNGYQPQCVSLLNAKGKKEYRKVKMTDAKDYVNGKLQSVWVDTEGLAWIWNGYANAYEAYQDENGKQLTKEDL